MSDSKSKSATEITELVTDPQELTEKEQQSVAGGRTIKAVAAPPKGVGAGHTSPHQVKAPRKASGNASGV